MAASFTIASRFLRCWPAAHFHLQTTAIKGPNSVPHKPVANSQLFSPCSSSPLLQAGYTSDMKQKIVIRLSMASEKSRSKAMVLVAKLADGISSMEITGDGKDRLEVVGVDVDAVCLVTCLRKKLGYADIVKVEEVKEKQQPEKPKVVEPPPYYCPCYYGYYCHYHHH